MSDDLYQATIPGNGTPQEFPQEFRIPPPPIPHLAELLSLGKPSMVGEFKPGGYSAQRYAQVAHYTATAMAAEAMEQTQCSRRAVIVNIGELAGPTIQGIRQVFIIQDAMHGRYLAIPCSNTPLSQLIDKIKEFMQ